MSHCHVSLPCERKRGLPDFGAFSSSPPPSPSPEIIFLNRVLGHISFTASIILKPDSRIPDPTATKPDDWDEDAPPKIPDADAVKPDGWLDDGPEFVPDPEAEQPDDWYGYTTDMCSLETGVPQSLQHFSKILLTNADIKAGCIGKLATQFRD